MKWNFRKCLAKWSVWNVRKVVFQTMKPHLPKDKTLNLLSEDQLSAYLAFNNFWIDLCTCNVHILISIYLQIYVFVYFCSFALLCFKNISEKYAYKVKPNYYFFSYFVWFDTLPHFTFPAKNTSTPWVHEKAKLNSQTGLINIAIS